MITDGGPVYFGVWILSSFYLYFLRLTGDRSLRTLLYNRSNIDAYTVVSTGEKSSQLLYTLKHMHNPQIQQHQVNRQLIVCTDCNSRRRAEAANRRTVPC